MSKRAPARKSSSKKRKVVEANRALAVAHRQLTDVRNELMMELTEANLYRTAARSENPADWVQLSGSAAGTNLLDHASMIRAAREYARLDPNARAGIMGMLKYVMGRGVNVTPKSKDPRVWYVWREFWTAERNNMKIRQFDIGKRFFRDGEVFIRYFNTRSGTPTWRTTVRFIDPLDIHNSGDVAKDDGYVDGIKYDENDAEKPVSYMVHTDNGDGTESFEEVPAEEMQVISCLKDMDQARADSFILPVMKLYGQYQEWLKNRMILNKLRTAIVMIKEIESGSASDVAALTATMPNSSRSGLKKQIQSGTIYTAGPGVKLRMDSPNINATDVKDDGRNVILQMAAGTGMPEYLYGDASNSNFASSLIAESPFVKEVQFWQVFLESSWIEGMFRRVIKAAVDARKIPEPIDDDVFEKFRNFDPANVDVTEATGSVPDETPAPGDARTVKDEDDQPNEPNPYGETATEIFYGCDVQWPEIVYRDPKANTEALAMQREMGWLSDKTASEILGYDYAEEVRKQKRLEAEAEKNGNPLTGQKPGEQAGDDEANAGEDEFTRAAAEVMAGMTPEEKKALADGDAATVMKWVQGKLNVGGGK